MANVILRSDERRAQQAAVLRQFGRAGSNVPPEHREAADCIAYRTGEVKRELQRLEEKYK